MPVISAVRSDRDPEFELHSGLVKIVSGERERYTQSIADSSLRKLRTVARAMRIDANDGRRETLVEESGRQSYRASLIDAARRASSRIRR